MHVAKHRLSRILNNNHILPELLMLFTDKGDRAVSAPTYGSSTVCNAREILINFVPPAVLSLHIAFSEFL